MVRNRHEKWYRNDESDFANSWYYRSRSTALSGSERTLRHPKTSLHYDVGLYRYDLEDLIRFILVGSAGTTIEQHNVLGHCHLWSYALEDGIALILDLCPRSISKSKDSEANSCVIWRPKACLKPISLISSPIGPGSAYRRRFFAASCNELWWYRLMSPGAFTEEINHLCWSPLWHLSKKNCSRS